MKDALSELLPRQARLWLYVITGTILLVLGTYEATEGNWLTFAVTLAGALQSNLAIVNLPPKQGPEALPEGPFNG